MVAVSDFSGLASSIWALASAPAIAPMVSLERCIGDLLLHEVEVTAPDFERLARTPWPIASLASSGISFFNSALAASWSRYAARVWQNTPANSAQELDELISTIRTASTRSRGGSTPNRRGVSPLSTQRQN